MCLRFDFGLKVWPGFMSSIALREHRMDMRTKLAYSYIYAYVRDLILCGSESAKQSWCNLGKAFVGDDICWT